MNSLDRAGTIDEHQREPIESSSHSVHSTNASAQTQSIIQPSSQLQSVQPSKSRSQSTDSTARQDRRTESSERQSNRKRYFTSKDIVPSNTKIKLIFILANWSIVNLRPAPPLRPMLTNTTSNGSGGTTLQNPRKSQPTYEEDALVLRVIEAYCVAYQNPSRHAVHSGMFSKLCVVLSPEYQHHFFRLLLSFAHCFV